MERLEKINEFSKFLKDNGYVPMVTDNRYGNMVLTLVPLTRSRKDLPILSEKDTESSAPYMNRT